MGKTTALHRLISYALRLEGWQNVLICDGKGHLGVWREGPGLTYLGPHQIEGWLVALEQLAAAVPIRYDDLLARRLYEAPQGSPRNLILIDEVRRGTRAKQGVGKRIKDALSTLAEQSAALGDVLIMASQREVNAIPPDVRANKNAHLNMLGRGYFFYKADGLVTVSGRVAYVTAEEGRTGLADPLPERPGPQRCRRSWVGSRSNRPEPRLRSIWVDPAAARATPCATTRPATSPAAWPPI